MSTSPVEIIGGGFDGLLQAVAEVHGGRRVTYVEPALRAGGALLTESFLSPFRFNIGPALVRRPALPLLRVLEPDPLVAVDGATLGRASVALSARGDVGATLDASGVVDPARRSTLTALALLLGLDPELPGSGSALAQRCATLDALVAVEGGNGVAVACLVDAIVAGGSHVIEGVGPVARPRVDDGALGICRLFVGVQGDAPRGPAFATAVGFDSEGSLREGLARLRGGDFSHPLGFLLSNAHLDANIVDPRLSSFVFQGVLPMGAAVSRADYASRVLEHLDVDPTAVVFQLLWLSEDTAEVLGAEHAAS